MDPRRAPERVGKAHVADQLTYLKRHGRPSAARPDFQRQYALNPIRCQRITVSGLIIASAARTSGEQTEADENQPIGPAEGRPLWPRPPQNIELLAQHQILSFKRRPRAE